ncbi:MAG: signal recognition particle-docking protein FtsY [Methylococcaceae bacterium]
MFRKTTLFTLVLALVIIVLGSYIRSSGVELGCPDWPGCYGKALVSSDAEFISNAQKTFANTLLNLNKAKLELTLRYLALAMAGLLFVLAIFSWVQKGYRRATVASTTLLLGLIALYAMLSKWVVEFKGMPVVLTGYVLLGFVLFWVTYWLYLRLKNASFIKVDRGCQKGPVLFSALSILVLFVLVSLGIWTSTNGAALACAGFPQCNNSWIPAVNFLQAFDVFAGLKNNYLGLLSFDGQVAVQWIHRVGTLFCFMFLTGLMLKATSGANAKPVRKAGIVLSVFLLIEIMLGIAIIRMELPRVIGISHSLFAALLMLPVINIFFYSRYALIDTVAETESLAINESVAEADVLEDVYVEPTAESLYLRLKTQLKKTRTGLGGVLSAIPLGQKEINQDLLEEIESSLIMADIGIDATNDIISRLTESLERHQLNDGLALETALKQMLLDMLQPCCQPLKIPEQQQPFVILVVGINGVGKTTTIGKLAKRLQVQGHSVMLAAGDTFRAAAVEQLQAWGDRNNIHVVAQHTGADSASVIYDGVQSAQAKGIDVLIADTAGRLHTKSNLMEELGKIKRIMKKVDETAPHEVLLVLDAGTGQNALSQTKIFNEVVGLTGLAVTKLDGTAKGGVMFALARQFGLPIRFIGVGEGIDDLQDFDAQAFVDALFVKD